MYYQPFSEIHSDSKEGPIEWKVKNAEARPQIAHPEVSGQGKQLPEIVQTTGKATPSLGKWRTGCSMVLVDRRARFPVGEKLDDHRPETLKESPYSSLRGWPRYALTVDNGREFATHEAITAESRVLVSLLIRIVRGERLASESATGLSRQLSPKYASFLTVTRTSGSCNPPTH